MITFGEQQIVDLSLIGKDENRQDMLLCTTETEMHKLALSSEGKIVKVHNLTLTGKAISVRHSKLAWNS